MTHPGPCASCGATNYEDIGGDPRICPRCDCGAGQGERTAALEAELARLTAEKAAAFEAYTKISDSDDATIATLEAERDGWRQDARLRAQNCNDLADDNARLRAEWDQAHAEVLAIDIRLKAEVDRLRAGVKARDAERWHWYMESSKACIRVCVYCGVPKGLPCETPCPTVTHPLDPVTAKETP